MSTGQNDTYELARKKRKFLEAQNTVNKSILKYYSIDHSDPKIFISTFSDVFGKKNPSSGETIQWYKKIKDLLQHSSSKSDKRHSEMMESIVTGHLNLKHLIGEYDRAFKLLNNDPRYGMCVKMIHIPLPFSFKPTSSSQQHEDIDWGAFANSVMNPFSQETKSFEIVLVDYFHQNTKKFKPNEQDLNLLSPEEMFSSTFIRPIDLNHAFIFLTEGFSMVLSNQSFVYLIKLDHELNEFKILDQQIIKFDRDSKLLFDSFAPKSFVAFSWKTDIRDKTTVFYAQVINILNDELIVDRAATKIGKYQISCPRLQNGLLSGFCLGIGREIYYWTFDNKLNKLVKQFDFQQIENVELEKFDDSTKYAWFEDKCFATAKSTKNFQNCLYLFDVSTQKCTMGYQDFLNASSLNFDLDGNLIATKETRLFYFSIKKPQKLEQIVWREVRRQDMFFDNKNLYNQAIRQLPLTSKMQPFHI